MTAIRLPRGTWSFDETRPIGPAGGFGQVFEGADLKGSAVAIKRLKVDATSSGHREVEIVDALIGRTLAHVIPVYDAGLDSESGRFYVVMARAERSLRDVVRARRRLPEAEVVAILEAIARGLVEIDDVVHRDLKPDNVLFHDGAWQLADLGIARFTEEATSSNTMRECLTPAYAAPEQWRGERATHATDVYALGCTAFELLEGAPPFSGATHADYAKQHLTVVPAAVAGGPGMRLLVANCLRKPPESRPTPAGLLERLSAVQVAGAKPGEAPMAVAAAAVAQERAAAEARSEVQKSAAESRRQICESGVASLGEIVTELLGRADEESHREAREVGPGPRRSSSFSPRGRALGKGQLMIAVPFPQIPDYAFPNSRLKIAAGAVITVVQEGHPYCGGRGANLWYGDLRNTGSYSWYEQAYMVSALLRRDRPSIEPFGVGDIAHLEEVDKAHSMIATLQRASKLRCIEGPGLEPFIRRWLERFALAAQFNLQLPNSMPDEDVNGVE